MVDFATEILSEGKSRTSCSLFGSVSTMICTALPDDSVYGGQPEPLRPSLVMKNGSSKCVCTPGLIPSLCRPRSIARRDQARPRSAAAGVARRHRRSTVWWSACLSLALRLARSLPGSEALSACNQHWRGLATRRKLRLHFDAR